ncbi:hypothetical protein CerSpe_068080 [Prunus speciosa]
MCWLPQRPGFVKTNIDGAWIKESGNSGLGVVIRDSNDIFYGGMATHKVCDSALLAEIEAAIEGLKVVIHGGGYRRIILETDCKTVLDGISGKVNNRAWDDTSSCS